MTLNISHRAVIGGQLVEVEILETKPYWLSVRHRVAYETKHISAHNREQDYTTLEVVWISDCDLLDKYE